MTLPELESVADLAGRLPPDAGRLLALDVGRKTIGLALSDPQRVVATPLATRQRAKFAADAQHLAAIVQARGVAALVVGMPLHLGGEEGRRAQSTRDFCRELAGRAELFAPAAPPLLLADERLSSAAAEDALRASGAGQRERQQRIDSHAATWFLQAVLDQLAATAE